MDETATYETINPTVNPVTGQTEDPALSARVKARQLEEKENLTLAEKLILASSRRKIAFDYEGIEVEVYVTNSEEYSKLVYLNQVLMDQTTEDPEGDAKKLYELVAGLCVDDSLTPEILESGAIGISFIPKIIHEVSEYEKDRALERTRISNFRKK